MPAFLTHFVFDVLTGCAAVDADRQRHGFPEGIFVVPAHCIFDVFRFKMPTLATHLPKDFPHLWFFDFAFSFHGFYSVITLAPNKSPEPTAVGASRSAIAVHVTSRRWLSFFR